MSVNFGIVASVEVAVDVCSVARCNSILVGYYVVVYCYFVVSAKYVFIVVTDLKSPFKF